MSPTLTDLVIHTPFAGSEEKFSEAIRVREQHWAGRAGLGNVRPSSGLHEVMVDRGGDMCERLMAQGLGESDFRYAASRFEATGDPGLRELAQHMRAFEMFAAEQAERELTRQMGMTESMTEFLREAGVPMREDMGRPGNVGRGSRAGVAHEPLSLPRTAAPLSYPDQTRPADDREVRGARDLPLSARILDAAREMAGLANAAKDTRTKNLISKYASRLRQMYARQLEHEDASEVIPSNDDEAELNNATGRLIRDMRTEARAAGAQDDDFRSFDDWDDGPRQGSDDEAIDDVDGQKRAAADDMAVDEDLPKIPAPGRRVDEDDLGDASLHADDVPGRRKNTATHLALPKGNVYRGKPAGRYSAFGKESVREADLTGFLINELDLNYRGSHS